MSETKSPSAIRNEMLAAFSNETIWDKDVQTLRSYLKALRSVHLAPTHSEFVTDQHCVRIILAILQTRQLEEERRRNDTLRKQDTRRTAFFNKKTKKLARISLGVAGASMFIAIAGVIANIVQVCQSHNSNRYTLTQAGPVMAYRLDTKTGRVDLLMSGGQTRKYLTPKESDELDDYIKKHSIPFDPSKPYTIESGTNPFDQFDQK